MRPVDIPRKTIPRIKIGTVVFVNDGRGNLARYSDSARLADFLRRNPRAFVVDRSASAQAAHVDATPSDSDEVAAQADVSDAPTTAKRSAPRQSATGRVVPSRARGRRGLPKAKAVEEEEPPEPEEDDEPLDLKESDDNDEEASPDDEDDADDSDSEEDD